MKKFLARKNRFPVVSSESDTESDEPVDENSMKENVKLLEWKVNRMAEMSSFLQSVLISEDGIILLETASIRKRLMKSTWNKVIIGVFLLTVVAAKFFYVRFALIVGFFQLIHGVMKAGSFLDGIRPRDPRDMGQEILSEMRTEIAEGANALRRFCTSSPVWRCISDGL